MHPTPLTIDQIRFLLSDRKLSIISERAGVSYATLYRIMNVPESRPNYRVVENLTKYFRNQIDSVQ